MLHGYSGLVKPANASGLGASLVVAGLLIAARPFVRVGVRAMAKQQVQAPQFSPLLDSEGRIIREAQENFCRKVDAVVPDIVSERVVAFWVILIGTALNGYGPVLGRLLHGS